MTTFIKPTQADCDIIRRETSDVVGIGKTRFKMEPGVRHNVDDESIPHHMNILRVTKTKDGSWEDTDLFDHASWDAFRRGFEAADGGRAEIDFYVYSLGEEGELETNIQAIYEDGQLVRIEEQGAVHWQR